MWSGFLLMRCGIADVPYSPIFVRQVMDRVIAKRQKRDTNEEDQKIGSLFIDFRCTICREERIIHFTTVVSMDSSFSWYVAVSTIQDCT